MYDYGSGRMGIWKFTASGSTFTPSASYVTGLNQWNVPATKFMTSGDFNGDGKADIAAMYDYGNGRMGIWNFTSHGTTYVPRASYVTGLNQWNVPATKFMTAGDFNGDGKADIAAMYDYGRSQMGIWNFTSRWNYLYSTSLICNRTKPMECICYQIHDRWRL